MSDFRPKDDDLLDMWERLRSAKEFSGYVDMMIAIDVVSLIKEVERWRKSAKEYTDTLNQARRKRDSVKNKLSVALKTIKEQKQIIKELETELEGYKDM